MGHANTHEQLALRWAELCADPMFNDLPAKIELNAYGVIEMSPANNRHGRLQMAIGMALQQQLPGGTSMVECCIATTEGLRVPDVAWASAAFMAQYLDITPFPKAPEICVEVRSPSNTDAEMEFKTTLFLAAGAVEVWIVDQEAGKCEIFDASGAKPAGRYNLTLPTP